MSSIKPDFEERMRQNAASRYKGNLAALVADLHHLADIIERDGKTREDIYRMPHLYAAHRVAHHLAWGFANLPTDNLNAAALDADTPLETPEAAHPE